MDECSLTNNKNNRSSQFLPGTNTHEGALILPAKGTNWKSVIIKHPLPKVSYNTKYFKRAQVFGYEHWSNELWYISFHTILCNLFCVWNRKLLWTAYQMECTWLQNSYVLTFLSSAWRQMGRSNHQRNPHFYIFKALVGGYSKEPVSTLPQLHQLVIAWMKSL